jgi:hypothetical protein
MKFIITVCMMFVSLSALAIDSRAVSEAGFSKLTAAQQAQVIANISTMATDSSTAIPTAAKMDDYVTLGEHIGKTLGGAAKEVGVAVSTFVETPVGKVTTFIILWKLIGTDMMHVVAAAMLLAVGFPFIWFVARNSRNVKITYDDSKTNIFGNHPVTSVVRSELSGDMVVGAAVMAALILMVAFISLSTM